MDDIRIKMLADETYHADILIEGLPGVGQVGKLVAEHMIEEFGAEKIAEITSIFFPPQVLIDESGVARLSRNEVYLINTDDYSIAFLIGDVQSASAEGHYLLADAYLDIAEELGVKRIYTLGGYGTGQLQEEIRVFGAVSDVALRESAEEAGVIFSTDEPGGGIIGASGLLLSLGAERGIEGICLMGETSGYIVDPKSAHAVLGILSALTGLDIDDTKLEERAVEMEGIVEKIKELENAKAEEELSYIG
ncbi:proteasome assembly chaperone family protein [Methanogenium cariaci]